MRQAAKRLIEYNCFDLLNEARESVYRLYIRLAKIAILAVDLQGRDIKLKREDCELINEVVEVLRQLVEQCSEE